MKRLTLLPARWSLRGRLTAILLIALLPAAVLAVMLGLRSYYSGIDFRNRALTDQARLFASEVRTSVVQAGSFVRLVAARPDVRGKNKQTCEAAFASAAELSTDLSALAMFANDGTLLCGWGAVDAFGGVAGAHWFKLVLGGAPMSIAAISGDSNSQARQFLAALPQSRAGDDLGVIAAIFSVSRFSDAIDAALAAGGSNFALLDNENSIVISAARDGKALEWLPKRPLLAPENTLQSAATVARKSSTGSDFLYVMAPIGPSGLYAVSGVRASMLYSEEWVQLGSTIALPLALLLLAITTIWFSLERLLIGGLQRMSRAVRRYGAGDQTVRAHLPLSASAELVDLQDNFNTMADNIEVRSTDLREAVAEQELLLRELHHRVKNNFQLISSLINLRLPKLTVVEAAELRAIQDRVQAIATAYRIAYASGQTGAVSMKQLATDLIGHFRNDPRFRKEPIRAQIDTDAILLDLDQAVPTGLLITEAFEQFAPRAGENAIAPISMGVKEEGDALRMVFTGIPAPDGKGRESAEYSRRFLRAFVQQLHAQLIIDTDKKTGVQSIDIYIPVDFDDEEDDGETGEEKAPAVSRSRRQS